MSRLIHFFGSRHKSERTLVSFDFYNNRILTASTDGKLRVYSNKDDPIPIEYIVGEPVNCILCKDEIVIIGTENSHVYLQYIDGGLLEGVATRFTAGVNCLALNKDKTCLLAGSSDFLVKLIDLNGTDATSREAVFKGHTGPVLSVDFDPLETFAASSSCDGTVRIWRLNNSSEVKCLPILPSFSDAEFASSRCKLKWEPAQGEFLVVPVESVIHIYDRHDNWNLSRRLRHSNVKKPFVEIAFSPDYEVLAAISADGYLVVWNPRCEIVLHSICSPALENVCSMIWPQKDTIYCADKFGAVGFMSINPSSFKQGNGSTGLSSVELKELFGNTDSVDFDDLINIAADQAEEEAAAAEAETAAKKSESSASDSVSEVLDCDDDSNTVAISKIKSSFLRDLDATNDNAVSELPTSPVRASAIQLPSSVEIKAFQPGSMPPGFRERFLVWNHVGVVILFEGEDTENFSNASIEVEFHDTTLHHGIHLEAQGFTMADLNSTALMLASPGSADVNLTDAFDSGRTVDYTDLSAVLVRPLNNRGIGREFNSTVISDWMINLPPGEACRAVCLVLLEEEEGIAVAATSSRLLRIFRQPPPSAAAVGGSLQLLQVTSLGLPPISLPGRDVVTMASHPSLPILAVVVGYSNEDLYWRVFNFSTTDASPRGWAFGRLCSTFYPLPLSPSAQLTWLGFSDVGNLFAHDSAGCLRRLTHQSLVGAPQAMDFHWNPVCETRRCVKPQHRLNDCFFVVGVLEHIHQPMENKKKNPEENDGAETATSDRMQQIRRDELGFGQVQAIYCKASRWPRPIPRPIISTLPFRIPLCGVYETDQGSLEENYIRTLVLDQKPFWGTDSNPSVDRSRLISRRRTLLRLFALVSKLDNDWAAVAVAGLMPDVETIQLAIRYALRLNRSALATRVGQIALAMEEARNDRASSPEVTEKSEKENEEDDDQEEEEEDAAEVLGKDDDEESVAEEEEAEVAASVAPSTSSLGTASQSQATTMSLSSTQGRRFNPFRQGGDEAHKPQFGGRGSCVLDNLKPSSAKLQPSAKSSVQTEKKKTSTGKTTNKPASRLESTNSAMSKRGAAKRPSSVVVSERAAKRLSTFECPQKKC